LLVRNAGVAGVLSRSMAQKANVINALQFAADRGLTYAEHHETHTIGRPNSVTLELETDSGTTTVEGAVMFDQPRLLQVDGTHCEMLLSGHLLLLKNHDVPGVIGWVGTVLGKNNINIGNFSLGRTETKPGEREALAIIETDTPVPDAVVQQLLENKAVKLARPAEF
jgi:D-3-phosphoglycerate dehydrogenase